MPLYTYYCRRSDGTPVSFETQELSNDDDAVVRLDSVLKSHASCDVVEVFQDERLVSAASRAVA